MSTLLQLRTRVRGKVDEATAAFWIDDVINDSLNEAYRYYYFFILEAYEGYFNTKTLIDFNANADGLYALPADCSNPNKIRLVSRSLNGGQNLVPLKYFERYDNQVNSQISQSTYNLPTFRFRGLNILLEPAPNFSEVGALVVEYSRKLPDLTDSVGVDSEFPSLGEDCVVIAATIKCKGIEEMVAGGGADVDPFKQELLKTEQLLKESVSVRTQARQYVEQFGEDDNNSMQRWY